MTAANDLNVFLITIVKWAGDINENKFNLIFIFLKGFEPLEIFARCPSFNMESYNTKS